MPVLYIVLGVTVVALIVLTTLYFIKQRKAKKAAAQAEEPTGPGGDEISVLIHEAERKLAAAKLEQGARVGNLPVFLIMGEPGSTKTSVMLHSGLEPELIAGQVYQSGNVTPTRTANFWFSRRTLFVEAGGQLMADAGKWRSAIKRLQPRTSVVGKGEQAPRAAVVCFDTENFTKPGAADLVTNAARNLRARLGEISQAMGINLPVYALFTKIDRVPFFTEFVRNLSNDEATQVVGVTLPMVTQRSEGVYAEEETARLAANFERLFCALADARPEFLIREGDGTKLPAAYEFPREFRKIRGVVVQFLVDLCRPSQLTVGPFLRGFYFTGVRPVIINEGAPVSAPAPPQQQAAYGGAAGATSIFSAHAAQAAAQQAAPQVLGTRKVPQWLFLSHLFNDILLADRAALGASGSSVKTSSARRILFIAAAALSLLLSIFFTVSFFNNNALENRVRDAAKGIPATQSAGPDLAPVDSLRKLETLRQSLEELGTYKREGAPFFYKWGLYVGNDLYPDTRRIYFDRFRQLLLAQTQTRIVQDMKGLPSAPVAEHEYQPTYDELKAYLITTSNHDKSTNQFLPPVLMNWWVNRRTVDTERRDLAQKQFDFYATELKEENPFSSDNDTPSIANARHYLGQFAGMERVYAAILAEAGKSNPPINFNRQFPGSSLLLVDNYDVKGAYSKGGWKAVMDAIAHSDKYFKGEPWVLGEQVSANFDRDKLEQDLKARYYSDFVNQWTNYLKAGNVVKYADLKDAAEKLKQHSGIQAPVLELLSLASQNTAAAEPAQARVFQPAQAVTPPENTDKYIAAQNQDYINALVQLQSSVEAVVGQASNDAALAQTFGVAKEAEKTVGKMSAAFLVGSPVITTVQNLLLAPIINVEPLLKGVGATELNTAGKGLCGKFRTLLASKYPFNPTATSDATVADVNGLFKKPDGALWAFYEQNLKKLLVKQGAQYVPAPSPTVTLTPAFVNFFNTAANFGDVLYADGSEDPHFSYSLKPVPTDAVQSGTLHMDGQTLTFTGSSPSAAQKFEWRGTGTHGMTGTIKLGGSDFGWKDESGLWSVFRFFYDAERSLPSGTGQTQTLEWVVRSGKNQNPMTFNNKPVTVRFDLDMGATPPIFSKGFFTHMACVADVAKP